MLLRQRDQAIPILVVDGDRRAVLVVAFQCERPRRTHRRTQINRATLLDASAQSRQNEFGHAVRCVFGQTIQRVSNGVIGETLEKRIDILVEVDARHGAQGRQCFTLQVGARHSFNVRIFSGLMCVGHSQQAAPVCEHLVGGVEQAELHQLVGHHIRDHLGADFFPLRTACRELVFNNPLNERFSANRPRIFDPPLLFDQFAIFVSGHGRDPVDHAVRERNIVVDPLRQLLIRQCCLPTG